jgi:hypothetical protein
MTEGDGIVDEAAKAPMRKMVAEWLVEVYNIMPEGIGRNVWKKTGSEWIELQFILI